MKKLLFAPLLLLLLATACTSDKENIEKVWLGDFVEATDANSTEAKLAAATFGSIIKTMKWEFRKGGRLTTYVMGRERTGKYAISPDQKTLTFTFDNGVTEVYELAAISAKDLYIKSTDQKVNLRFVAEGADE